MSRAGGAGPRQPRLVAAVHNAGRLALGDVQCSLAAPPRVDRDLVQAAAGRTLAAEGSPDVGRLEGAVVDAPACRPPEGTRLGDESCK